MGPVTDNLVAVGMMPSHTGASFTHEDLRSLAAPFIDAPFGGELLREKLEATLTGDESLQLTVQVEDFFADGVALVILTRPVGP